jgi:Fe-S cluster biogenesis protein NfuA
MQTTPNPDSMKFLPENREVLPASLGTGLQFMDAASARGSPLASRLLRTKEITSVFFGPDFISVNKDEKTTWQQLKPIVVSNIMDAYAELDGKGVALVAPAPAVADAATGEEDTEVVAMIKELLETRIRPAVQEAGGDIHFVCVCRAPPPPLPSSHFALPYLPPPFPPFPTLPSLTCSAFDEASGGGKVRRAGSCVGCPSSSATLRNGVENMLCHYIPEVTEVRPVAA